MGRKPRCPRCGLVFDPPAKDAPPPRKKETRLTTGPLPHRAAPPPPRAAAVPPRPAARRAAAAPPDDDEDDRPRSRPGRAESSGGNGLALVLGLVAAGVLFVLVLGGGAIAVLLLVSRKSATPEMAQAQPAQNLAGDAIQPLANPGPAVQPPPAAPPAPDLDPIPPAAPGAGDANSIPLETMRALKAATAFIKVDSPGESASGSGFLIRAQGTTGYVVTNHHVITPEIEVRRSRLGRPIRIVPAGKPTITVVFNSGTADEQSARAEVVADDGEDDLAVLRVTGVRSLPHPIDYRRQPQLVETMPIYLFGFPFGEMLAMHKGNPAITVGKGAVSSIRLNDRGELAAVQIEGAVNPGNSGGPVVDVQGRLVGVTVAKITNTTIGLAIPGQQLTKLLAGRVSLSRLQPRMVDNATAEVLVEARVQDPMGVLRGVSVLYARGGAGAAGNGPAAPRAGAQEAALTVQGDKATATVRVAAQANEQLAFQIAYVNGEGQQSFTPPLTCRLQAGGAPVVVGPGAQPAPPQADPRVMAPPPPPPEKRPLTDQEVAQVLNDLKVAGGFRRINAVRRLNGARPTDAHRAEVVQALLPLVDDQDMWTRMEVAKALAAWGPKEAVPALIKLLKDDQFAVRWAVLDLMGDLKDERAAEAVAACLPKDGFKAGPALIKMGPVAEKATLPYLANSEWGVRLQVCKVLKEIGTKASVGPLQKAAQEGGLVGPAAQEALQAIAARG